MCFADKRCDLADADPHRDTTVPTRGLQFRIVLSCEGDPKRGRPEKLARRIEIGAVILTNQAGVNA